MKHILIISIMLFQTSCFQNETTESLLSPAYKKCKLKSETINGKKSIAVVYNGNIIESVEFYNNDGSLNTIRNYTYDGDKISQIEDSVNKWEYLYNTSGDLEKEKYCTTQGNCCNTILTYEYNGGSCPIVSREVDCTSGYFRKIEYKYLNQYSCSNFGFFYLRNGSVANNEDESSIKYDNIINPYILIFPGEDYYLNEIKTVGNQTITTDIIEINESGYPTKVDFQINGQTYTYQYDYTCE